MTPSRAAQGDVRRVAAEFVEEDERVRIAAALCAHVG